MDLVKKYVLRLPDGVKTVEKQEIVDRVKEILKDHPSEHMNAYRVWYEGFEGCGMPGTDVYDVIVETMRSMPEDWKDIGPVLEEHKGDIQELVVENDSRNSAIPLLDKRTVNARIEPGAILREQVEIGDNAVIMMGAILNIGAVVGAGTMIDMGAVLGGRATVGKNCHIGAGTVLAGVIEPASAVPVVIEDDVVIGANAVVLEGCRVGKGAVVAAGAVVVSDVAPNTVVAGVPARVLKDKDGKTAEKTALIDALRAL